MRYGTLASAACFLIMAAAVSHAQIIGGSNIITNADVTTLSGYLGEGPLQLTNIFSHVSGDGKTSTDFHTAADGKGRTFSIEKVTAYDTTTALSAIIGGYDPLSWNSSDSFNLIMTDAERTAFIFNLTTRVEQKQNLISQGVVDSGLHQTYNGPSLGPTFGGGFDIYVDSTLNGGFAYNESYGGGSFGTNIIGNPNGSYYTAGLVYTNLEVFTIAPAATPEPGSIALLASLGLTGAAFLRRRKSSRQ